MRGEEVAETSFTKAGCRWGMSREDSGGPVLTSPMVVGLGKARSSTKRVREWEEPGPHGDRPSNYKFLDWKNCGLHVIGSNGM